MKEQYYAIRIGDPKKREPYFLIRNSVDTTPQLFMLKEEAEKARAEIGGRETKVVRVWVTTK